MGPLDSVGLNRVLFPSVQESLEGSPYETVKLRVKLILFDLMSLGVSKNCMLTSTVEPSIQ